MSRLFQNLILIEIIIPIHFKTYYSKETSEKYKEKRSHWVVSDWDSLYRAHPESTVANPHWVVFRQEIKHVYIHGTDNSRQSPLGSLPTQ